MTRQFWEWSAYFNRVLCLAKEQGRILSPGFIGFSNGKGKWKNFEPLV
jgi:hypothetical protein